MKTEIRPNPGAVLKNGRCEDVDEVLGTGELHVEQMNGKMFWARLYVKDGPDIVMWFQGKGRIQLIAELE